MAHTIQRLTMYSLISSLETDLRDVFSLHIAPGIPASMRLDEQVSIKASERFSRDLPEGNPSLDDLLAYIDLADLITAIRKNDKQLDSSTRAYFKKLYVSLDGLVPIRNRVMHSRPLEYDDLPRVLDLCDNLEKSNRSLWANIRTSKKLLERNPDFVTSLVIPEAVDDSTNVLHNLPSSEFDDTGFMGRVKQMTALRSALAGPYPVVTIVGEGGLGKTALALKTCYDLIDDPSCTFDAIVWVTAKTTKLTANEVQVIKNAISSSLGVIEEVSGFLGRQNADAMQDLITHLEDNKILLVIDNLESVVDQTLRDLASRVPSGSRILFTTRIGLGAFDFPIPLAPMDHREASLYFRRTAKVWALENMAELPQEDVESYCNRLQNNPLFIKCFIQSVASGGRPSSIVNNPTVLLQFCLQNVFNSLQSTSKKVAGVLASLDGPQSLASLAFFTDLDSLSVQSALSHLLTSNLVTSERGRSSEDEDRYLLSSLSRLYVRQFLRASPDEQRLIIRKQGILRSAQEEYSARAGSDAFDINYVHVREKDDYLVARLLTKAIEAIFKKRQEPAESLLRQAEDLSPSYFEVHRVKAMLLLMQEDVYGAKAEYEAAVSLAPDRATLRLWYGGFLLRSLDDKEEALKQFLIAETLAPQSEAVKLECARVLQYKREFAEADKRLSSIQELSHLSARTRRVHLDLTLKNSLKDAEHLCGIQSFSDALTRLQSAQITFDAASSGLVDHRTIRTLARSWRIMPDMRRAFAGLPEEMQLQAYEKWLAAKTAANSGSQSVSSDVQVESGPGETQSLLNRGRLAQISDQSAFVVMASSKRFQFSGDDWIGQTDFRKLPDGTVLTFSLKINSSGAESVGKVKPVQDENIESKFGMIVTGTIREIRPTFGFITLGDGRNLYFHRSNVASTTKFNKMFKGQRIRCIFTRNEEGRVYGENVESFSGVM